MIGKDSYEVTTYRIDGAYEDSRHPKEVPSLYQLVWKKIFRRRDFTINAMAYNDDVRLVDVFGGMQGFESSSDPLQVGDPREKIFRRCTSYPSVRYASQHSWIS